MTQVAIKNQIETDTTELRPEVGTLVRATHRNGQTVIGRIMAYHPDGTVGVRMGRHSLDRIEVLNGMPWKGDRVRIDAEQAVHRFKGYIGLVGTITAVSPNGQVATVKWDDGQHDYIAPERLVATNG